MNRVGVLFGGPSSEHDVSLMSGLNVLRALEQKGYEAVPIFITTRGSWLFGKDKELIHPHDALLKVSSVFNAMHGEFGEDGAVQQILEQHNIPYTGSEPMPSAVAMNKALAQQALEAHGLRLPKTMVVGPENLDTRLILQFSAPPWIIKPRSRGSSVGVSKVKTKEELPEALRGALVHDTYAIVQEYIPGREVTCAVLEDFEGKKYAALAPIEIVPPKEASFFDYQVKYNGKTQEICPAPFYGPMLAKIQEAAITAHKALGLRHYSRTDMIIKTPEYTRKAPEIYVLETNSQPGLTSESLFPKAARHAGLEFPDLIEHLVRLSRRV